MVSCMIMHGPQDMHERARSCVDFARLHYTWARVGTCKILASSSMILQVHARSRKFIRENVWKLAKNLIRVFGGFLMSKTFHFCTKRCKIDVLTIFIKKNFIEFFAKKIVPK